MNNLAFFLYQEQEGGAPLWMETQNVQSDKTGHYTVMLGFTTSQGLPSNLFVTGEARWLGVQAQGQSEQPRVMLLAVPYALKAGDAETLGGRPASAYALAGSPAVLATGTIEQAISGTAGSNSDVQPMTTNCASVTSDGTAKVNGLAKFTTPCNVEGSAIAENSGRVGIGGAGVSGAKLALTDTQTNFGLKWLQHSIFDTSATANGTNYASALDADVSNMTIPAGVTDNGYRLGVYGRGFANSTGFAGTLAQQFGVNGSAGILAGNKSGAKVGSAYGGYYEIYNNVSGTTITDAYGVYISNSGTTGTITNRYDLYASSANAKNYFAGNVGVGTTTPAAKLEVNGTAKFDGLVTFAGGQSFPLPAGLSLLGASPAPPAGLTVTGFVAANGKNPWSQSASLNAARSDFGGAAIGSKIFVVGGFGGSYLSSLEEYDTSAANETWSLVTPGSGSFTARSGVAAATSSKAVSTGAMYVFGGSNDVALFSLVDMYDPTANSWTSKASLPALLYGPCAASDSSGYIYVLGGYNGSAISATVYKYDPTQNLYSVLAPMPVGVYQSACAKYNDKIYLFGGREAADDLGTNATQIYNIASNSWTTGAPGLFKIEEAAAAVLGSQIYVVGGFIENPGDELSTLSIYDPTSNTWTAGPQSPSFHQSDGGVTVSNHLYALAGISYSYSAEVDVYDPTAVEFIYTSN